MTLHHPVYDLLLDYASGVETVDELTLGLVWTACRVGPAMGLAHSPMQYTRTLPWSGTVAGRPAAEVAGWLREWEPHRATVGMAAVNALLSLHYGKPEGTVLEPALPERANLIVFEHFLPQLRGKNVVIVGRYPGLDALAADCRLTVLERQPGPGDLPDPACEYVLSRADWVFLTASSLPNKTFPRMAELARDATTVLMGPTTPWLSELAEFGIDWLAGTEVVDPQRLRTTVAEGGGVRIFESAVRYRIAPLTRAARLDWLRLDIARTFGEKERLTAAMEGWYGAGNSRRFPDYPRLDAVNRRLSRLDTAFKVLWDGERAPADPWVKQDDIEGC